MRISLLLISIVLLGFTFENFQEALTPFIHERHPGFTEMPVSKENLTTLEGAELGRFLFYDPILSRDSTISCATCHKQEYAFSDGGKKVSIGIDGQETERNTPPLFNLAWYPAMFWDGRAATIEEQVFFPVRDHAEMDLSWPEAEKRLNRNEFYQPLFKKIFKQVRIDSIQIAFAIAQFERTLISCDSKLDKAVRGEVFLTPDELRGFEVLNDQSMGDCIHCHATDGLTMGSSFKFGNNGIEDIQDINEYPDKGLGAITGDAQKNGWFKIPSVRNIAVTGPYMHDGRFDTMKDVLDFYSEGVHPVPNIDSKMTRAKEGGVHLSEEDKNAIITFFHALTDSSFLTNPAFSNPWED